MGKIINTLKALKILGSNYVENFDRLRFIPPKLDANERNILTNIKRHGYFVWKEFYTPEECQELKAEVDRLIDLERGLKIYDDSDYRIYPGNKYSEKINSFNQNKILNNITENFLKTRAKALFTLSARINYKAGNLGSGQGWHRDTYWPFQFKAMIYLTDVSHNSGPFEIIENSHTKYSLIRNAMNNVPPSKYRFTEQDILLFSKKHKKITFTGNAGDLIIFNSYCIHRGSPLQTGSRYALTNYYFPIPFIEKNKQYLEKKFKLNG